MKRVRILIADDHELIRIGVRTLLDSEKDIEVVGQATTGAEAVEQVAKLRPDVILLDVVMAGSHGIEVIRCVRALSPVTWVIAVTMHDLEEMVRAVFLAGASGYVLKTDIASELTTAIRAVAAGRRYLSPHLPQRLADTLLLRAEERKEAHAEHFTSREREIARMLSRGKSSKQIAAVLGISIRTVETHRANMMRKLKVHSVTELIHHMFAQGLLGAPGDPDGPTEDSAEQASA